MVGRRRVGSWREGWGGCSRFSRELPRGDPRCFAASRSFLAARPSWRRVSGEWGWAGAARAGAEGRCRVLTPPPSPFIPVFQLPADPTRGSDMVAAKKTVSGSGPRRAHVAAARPPPAAGAAPGQSGPRRGSGPGTGRGGGGRGHRRRRLSRPSELGPCPPCAGCRPRPAAASSPPPLPASLSPAPACALSRAAYGAPGLAGGRGSRC